MVELNLSPVQVTVTTDMRAHAEFPQVYDAPGGLWPLRAKTFELEEYRIAAGWPVPKPRHDIFARSLVSGSGARFTDRANPASLRTGANTRWIASDESMNYTTLTWSPIQDDTVGMTWVTSAGYAPVLVEDYTYRLGAEVFVTPALNFDSDDKRHFWTDMTSTYGGSAGYTVIMVMSPNSVYGNDPSVPYNGLWCPGHASPGTDQFSEAAADHYASVTMQGYYLYYEDELKDRTRMVSIANGLSSNAPVYLAMVFARPDVIMYAGSGPSSITSSYIPAGGIDPVPLDGHVTLGRTPGDVLHTADMALFDLGIYGRALSAADVAAEFSLLAQSYGGVTQ